MSRLKRGVAILDCGRKAVTIHSTGGVYEGTWSNAYSRDAAMDRIAQDGWREAPGATWVTSPANNGFRLEVIHDPVSVAARFAIR